MAEQKATQDQVMPLALVKRMLSIAEHEPLGCAFGLTKDKKECMLLIEKSGSAKKIAANLKAAGKDLALDPGTVRFGTVGPVLPSDPGTVRFSVNRTEAGGTIVTLTRLAKKAGYQGIVINVDPELDQQPEEGVAAPGAAPGQPKPPPPGQQPAEVAAAPRAAPPEGPKPPPPQGKQPDAGALAAELAALARRISDVAGSDPALRARLAKLATDCNVNLKTNNLNYAARGLAELRDAMRDGLQAARTGSGQATPSMDAATASPPASRPSATQTAGPDSAKLLERFRDAKDEVDQGLNKLSAALRETGNPDMLQIANYGLYDMTDGGGVGLMKALLDLQRSSPDQRPAALQTARAAASAYKTAVLSNNVVDLVDDNPFGVTVGIQDKLVPALDEIANAP